MIAYIVSFGLDFNMEARQPPQKPPKPLIDLKLYNTVSVRTSFISRSSTVDRMRCVMQYTISPSAKEKGWGLE
jgi:hypothetical protein